MRSSRAKFKYAHRFTRNIEDTARVDSLAKDLSDGTIDYFGAKVKKLNSGNIIQAYTIEGFSGESDISEFWKDHFSKLLNANPCYAILKSAIMGKFDSVHYSNDMLILKEIISEAINELKIGKSTRPDGVYAESIKLAHHRPHVYFRFNSLYVLNIAI